MTTQLVSGNPLKPRACEISGIMWNILRNVLTTPDHRSAQGACKS
ncbi:MAG: hypothetical protein US49_C0001G0300 [candidate division TM6 bacterium GW2011_GWF2_37_49]|nr:MAG: hypothetical protein US49_C0001G0300 [candidate division TM6 bacterium GW2011_GWF2_37_49]